MTHLDNLFLRSLLWACRFWAKGLWLSSCKGGRLYMMCLKQAIGLDIATESMQHM